MDLDGLLKEADGYLGNYGKLGTVESKAKRELEGAIGKIEQWRKTRDWETRTPQGRLEYEDQVLSDAIAAENESDELVKAAREFAGRLDEAGHEPGAYKYGDRLYDPQKYPADEARFVSSYVALSDAALDSYNRVASLVADDVDAATIPAELERLLASAAGDKGRLFAVARAIERRQSRRDGNPAPSSNRIRELLDAAWESLRDPRRAKLREQAKAVSAKANEVRQNVWALRRDDLAREQLQRTMYSRF